MASRGEMIPIMLTRNQAQLLSVFAQFRRDEATVIMCDELVESGEPTGRVTLKDSNELDEYMSLIRRMFSTISHDNHDAVKILEQMVAITRK